MLNVNKRVAIFVLMKRIFLFLVLVVSHRILLAQTFNVFKGDTINRIDSKGLKQGLWRKYYETDTLYFEGYYKNGKRTGTFRTFHKNGQIQSILKFRGNTVISDAELMYDTGILMAKGKYIDKTKDSLWVFFDEEGKKSAEEFFLKGLKEGSWKIFHKNGVASQLIQYKAGMKNGAYKEFFDSGKIKMDGIMRNDEFVGKLTIYHPNGKIWQTGNYSKGLKDGKWIFNKEDGTLEKEKEFKNGVLTTPEEE